MIRPKRLPLLPFRVTGHNLQIDSGMPLLEHVSSHDPLAQGVTICVNNVVSVNGDSGRDTSVKAACAPAGVKVSSATGNACRAMGEGVEGRDS
jgi:hypothetical protein